MKPRMCCAFLLLTLLLSWVPTRLLASPGFGGDGAGIPGLREATDAELAMVSGGQTDEFWHIVGGLAHAMEFRNIFLEVHVPGLGGVGLAIEGYNFWNWTFNDFLPRLEQDVATMIVISGWMNQPHYDYYLFDWTCQGFCSDYLYDLTDYVTFSSQTGYDYSEYYCGYTGCACDSDWDCDNFYCNTDIGYFCDESSDLGR